jgi:hypothetical protein
VRDGADWLNKKNKTTTRSPTQIPNSVSLQATTTTTTTTTISAPTATLTRTPTVPPFTHAGCWTEGTGARALGAKTYASASNMTLDSCAAFCAGHRFFGTEYASECYCGDILHASASNASLADCAMPCSGDPSQYCGGAERLELYENEDVVVAPTDPPTDPPVEPSQPETVSTSEGAEWAFHGCVTEGDGVRALGAEALASDELTLEACAAFCGAYRFFGAEYGRECYCGNEIAESAAEVDAAECSMACAGDGEVLCGNGNRLSVYAKVVV